ncbi:hypothetical protein ACFFRR_004014 [Megaselia abdita]
MHLLVLSVLFCLLGVVIACQEYLVEGPQSHIYTNFFKLNRFQNNHPDEALIGWNAPEIYRLRFLVYGTSDAKLWINRYADEEELELVLGGENNTVSYLRNKTDAFESMKMDTADLLSPDEPTEVILIMTRHIFGRIRINAIIHDNGDRYVLKTKLSNKGNFDNKAFLISFRTTRNNNVRWLYDCPIENRGIQDYDFRNVEYPGDD